MATVVWASVKSGDDLRRRMKPRDAAGAAVNYGASGYDEEAPVRIMRAPSRAGGRGTLVGTTPAVGRGLAVARGGDTRGRALPGIGWDGHGWVIDQGS